ncbi:MAG: PEGA domain-containing protein [Paludibacter sp.]
MKKPIHILLVSLLSITLLAQNNIGIKSFVKVQNDMTARIDYPKKDQNGDVCAIIKVETTQTGFSWEPDGLGIMAAVPQVGEYWLYVPYGAKRLTIKHPVLGILRDYIYPLPIEKATVYVMTLVTGKVITSVEETIESQWLVITPEPADAAVYINDVNANTGVYQNKLKPGSYIYRVEAPLYHSEVGKVEITNDKKELNVKLKPAFGYITINTEPEKDAKVIIDGKTLTTNTPTKSEALASGEHTVQVMKEMYQPTTKKVIVTDGQTTPISFTMQPNFAELTVTIPAEATLYINNQQKATTSWTGRLNAGVYSLEARLDKHRPAKQDIELTAGDIKKIDLQPTPIYGSLDVVTSPNGANISINGKEYGTTPNTIKNLLIGDYTVQLTKTGFASVNKYVTVIEGKSIVVNEKLLNSGKFKINSNPTNADVFIEDKLIGKTPLNLELSYGKHTIKVVDGDKTNTQVINFGTESSSELSIELLECNVEKLIYSSPSLSSIIIEGKRVGSTPLIYQMLKKEENITIKKEGYKPYNGKIYCEGNNIFATLTPKKEFKFNDYISFGIPIEAGIYNYTFGVGLGLNIKIIDWFFIKNDFNVVLGSNYDEALLCLERNHIACLGVPIDFDKNLIFGEYGIGYGIKSEPNPSNLKLLNKYHYNIYGIGYGNYQNNIEIRYKHNISYEFLIRFGLFNKPNQHYRNVTGSIGGFIINVLDIFF